MEMKRIKIIFAIVTVILLTVTCKKEHVPATTTSTPVFYFNGMVGGISTSIDAGINNYYMYSSYTQDTNHVYNFIGNLQKTTTNINSIEIQLNDYKVSPINSNSQPDSSFATGAYSYYSVGVTNTGYNVQFASSYTNGTPQTYTWTFGDGTTSNSANPLHSYASIGNYNVCLTIAGSSGTSSICDSLNLSSPSSIAKKVAISSTSSGDTILFNTSTTGFIGTQFNWNFGDGSPHTIDSLTHSTDITSHTYATPGVYNISLSVKDSVTENIITTNYKAATTSYTAGVTNYTVSSITSYTTTGSSLRLSNVIVKWTNASGVVYTTNNNAAQPSGSFFKIISEEPYQNNTNGQLTRKLHVNFSCTLYNGTNSIQIANADAIIAVAYK